MCVCNQRWIAVAAALAQSVRCLASDATCGSSQSALRSAASCIRAFLHRCIPSARLAAQYASWLHAIDAQHEQCIGVLRVMSGVICCDVCASVH